MRTENIIVQNVTCPNIRSRTKSGGQVVMIIETTVPCKLIWTLHSKARLFEEKRHDQLDDECVIQRRSDEENLSKPGGINAETY